ncbi:MAG: PTS sugar transporter subunit IIA [Treponema sp.]|jgi:PTS system nitrogen regulatory IIA component|nr:PTS sugar transporter subunit IIA [Treponema sp.]
MKELIEQEPIADRGLITLIEQGKICQGIPGTTPLEVLTNIFHAIPVPAPVNRDVLLKAVLEREALMPTAIGHGIALPHPRNPLIIDPTEQFVTIAFLQQPVDWKALDGNPVCTLLLIVSASAKLHLHTLARINFFCQQGSFRELLENRASQGEIIAFIRKAEAAWR